MVGFWPCSFFAFLWTEMKTRSIKTQQKKVIGQYPAISVFTKTSLVNKGFIMWPKDYTKEFRFCVNKAGNPGKIGPYFPLR